MSPSDNVVTNLVQSILSLGVDGAGPLCSATELADEYRSNGAYESIEERVHALIRWESAKAFGTGLVTSLGGAVTLPIAVPTNLVASWVIQVGSPRR